MKRTIRMKKIMLYVFSLISLIVTLFSCSQRVPLEKNDNTSTELSYYEDYINNNKVTLNECDDTSLFNRYINIIANDEYTIDVKISGIGNNDYRTLYVKDKEISYQFRYVFTDNEETLISGMMAKEDMLYKFDANNKQWIVDENDIERSNKPNIPFCDIDNIAFKSSYVSKDNKIKCEEWSVTSTVSFDMKMYFENEELKCVNCKNDKSNIDFYINQFDNEIVSVEG